MPLSNGTKILVIFSPFPISVAASTNFTQCLIGFKEGGSATEGGTDYNGRPVINPKNAVSLSYGACMKRRGSGRGVFNWSTFSQQFSAWLLPWPALVSKLPFGAKSRLDNLISVALAVGFPALAEFTLVLTSVSARWANNHFSTIKYPNHKKALKALICLRQVPLRLSTYNSLLASPIVFPENEDWREYLGISLRQTRTQPHVDNYYSNIHSMGHCRLRLDYLRWAWGHG